MILLFRLMPGGAGLGFGYFCFYYITYYMNCQQKYVRHIKVTCRTYKLFYASFARAASIAARVSLYFSSFAFSASTT